MNIYCFDRARWRQVIVLVCLFLRVADHDLSAADTKAGQHEALIDAWNRRQDSVHTLQFSCSGTHFCRSDAVVNPLERHLLNKPGGPSDASYETQIVVVFDDKGRFRYDCKGKVWSLDESSYVPQMTTDLLDGQCQRTFVSHTGSVAVPNGYVTSGKNSPVPKDIRFVPIMLVYRPFDRRMGYLDATRLRLTTEQGIVDGRSCIVLRQQDTAGTERTIWADPARGFVPLRYFSGNKGVLERQIDIAYSKDVGFGWAPTSWNISLMDGHGRISESWSTNTVSFRLNEPLLDSTFHLDFPPGTLIHDYLAKEQYILRENGEKRPVAPGEFDRKNFDAILHSDPVSSGSRRRTLEIVICLAAAVLVLASLFLYRRRRRGPSVQRV